MKNKKITIIGSGVAGINAATKLLKNGYPGELIKIIDKGKDPYNRPKDEVMLGFAGCGLFSDGKWSYLHNAVGGQLAKYMGEDRADQVLEEAWSYILEFHPDPSKIMFSQPTEEPDFIKPHFNLRMAPAYHVGTNYLHDMGKRWYDWLVDKRVNFLWETEVLDINFDKQYVEFKSLTTENIEQSYFDKLIYGTGKSGIDLTQKLIDKYNLAKESKSVQLGVRMELPQKYMQPIIDIAYDFKLYKRHNDKVSSRSFCLPGSEIIHIERNGDKLFTSIDNVLENDKILTYNFKEGYTEFIKPKTLFNREYKGDLITINNKLTTTEDHIYFVWEKEIIENEYNRKDGHKDDAFKLNKIIEKHAKDLIIGDRLVTPKNFPKLNQIKGTSYTNDQLWMFGLWFADGSGQYTSKWNSNSFTLTNEDYILDKVVEILKNQNEGYGSKKQYDNYSVLNFSSKILKEFLLNEDCFKKGKNRGLPKSIFKWSEEEIYSFISGLIDGDGRVKKEYNICLDYFTVSDLLYRDLTYLFNYLGITFKSRTKVTSTNFKENSKINIINIAQRDSMLLLSSKLNLQNIKKNKLLQENLNIEFKDRDTKNYEKVYSIESEYYEGTVYDFEVENTHNFIAGNTPLVIHNCSNNFAAYVAEEVTYDMKSYNGHSYKQDSMVNHMTNFGIIMEIKGINNPFQFQKDIVSKCQINGKGIHYSPNFTRKPSLTAEGKEMNVFSVGNLDLFKETYGEYAEYIINYIEDLNKVFNFKDDYSLYIPEVKFLSEEVLVNYDDLSLIDYPNIHFVGDSLSSRGIAVSAAQGVYSVSNF